MNSISNLIAAVLLLLSLSLHSQILAHNHHNPTVGGDEDLITKSCTQTPFKDLCIKTLQASPKSKGAADLYALAQIVMDIAAENVSNIYESLNQLQNGTSVDSFVDQCLTDCLESYQDAIDQIEDSVTALDFKAYHDVRTWVAAAMSDIATCDLGFKEKPGYKSPVAEMSSVFEQLCNIITAFAHQLSQEGGKHSFPLVKPNSHKG